MSKREPRPGEGRPTKFKQEFCQMLIDHMRQGYGINTFGAVCGVRRETIYDWLNKREDFRVAHDEGKAYYEQFWEKLGIAGTMGKLPGFNASAWIFNMKNRFKWTDRQETVISEGRQLQHATDEELDAILADAAKI